MKRRDFMKFLGIGTVGGAAPLGACNAMKGIYTSVVHGHGAVLVEEDQPEIPKELADLHSSLDRTKTVSWATLKHVTAARFLFDKMAAQGYDEKMISMSMYINMYSPKILDVRLWGITDIHVARAFLREFSRLGYRQCADKSMMESGESITWHLTSKRKDFGGNVSWNSEIDMQVTMGLDSTCQKVQVGTKEVPIYEIRCGKPGAVDEIPDEVTE